MPGRGARARRTAPRASGMVKHQAVAAFRCRAGNRRSICLQPGPAGAMGSVPYFRLRSSRAENAALPTQEKLEVRPGERQMREPVVHVARRARACAGTSARRSGTRPPPASSSGRSRRARPAARRRRGVGPACAGEQFEVRPFLTRRRNRAGTRGRRDFGQAELGEQRRCGRRPCPRGWRAGICFGMNAVRGRVPGLLVQSGGDAVQAGGVFAEHHVQPAAVLGGLHARRVPVRRPPRRRRRRRCPPSGN